MSDLRTAAARLLTHTYGAHSMHPEPIIDCAACEVRAALAEAAPPSRALDALSQAHDRMEAAWNLLHPGDLTDDELHGLSQNLWFGMEEVKAALGKPSYFRASPTAEPAETGS